MFTSHQNKHFRFVLNMAETNAEKMKKYREKLEKDKEKYKAVKAKAYARNNAIRPKLTGAIAAKFGTKAKLRQQNCRQNKIKQRTGTHKKLIWLI